MKEIVIGVIGGASGEVMVNNLHKYEGIKTALVAGKTDESGVAQSDYSHITDLRNVDEIESFFNKHGVKYVVLGTGHRFAFALAAELEKRGIVPNVNIQASLIAKNKKLYKDMIASKGFETAKYVAYSADEDIPEIQAIIDKVGLPCVVKSAVDTTFPQKASTKEELEKEIETVRATESPIVIEAFVDGIDVTVPVRVVNGTAKAYVVSYYSKASELELTGFSHEKATKRLSSEDEKRVLAYCEKLALASGFEGVPRIDAMVIPNGTIYILEANSVTATGNSGTQMIFYRDFVKDIMDRYGVDLAHIVVETALMKFGIIS